MRPRYTGDDVGNAIDFVSNWRDDDEELRIPRSDFGANLAYYIDILIDVARRGGE